MFNEYNSEIITLTDEKGQEIVADIVDQYTDEDGKTYIAIVPIGEEFSDDDLYALEKRVDKKGDEYMVDIESDAKFEEILEIFIRRIQKKEDEMAEATVLKYEL